VGGSERDYLEAIAREHGSFLAFRRVDNGRADDIDDLRWAPVMVRLAVDEGEGEPDMVSFAVAGMAGNDSFEQQFVFTLDGLLDAFRKARNGGD
jgi:hypothetical protein